MSSMTLKQIRDQLRDLHDNLETDASTVTELRVMANAIDAHIAQPAQAVDVVAIREVIDELDGYCEASDDSCYGTLSTSLVRGYTETLTRAIGNAQAEGWTKGFPTKHWADEWFIAVLKDGSRAVLRALPEEYSHDFKTADETYYTKEWVIKWMQFPDSQFIPPPQPEE